MLTFLPFLSAAFCAHLCLWLMDPDPTPDPTSTMQKKIFIIVFSYNLPAGIWSSVLKIKFFVKILCYNFILQALFQSPQHLYEKREGSGSGSIPWTNGSGYERTMWIRIPNPDEMIISFPSEFFISFWPWQFSRFLLDMGFTFSVQLGIILPFRIDRLNQSERVQVPGREKTLIPEA